MIIYSLISLVGFIFVVYFYRAKIFRNKNTRPITADDVPNHWSSKNAFHYKYPTNKELKNPQNFSTIPDFDMDDLEAFIYTNPLEVLPPPEFGVKSSNSPITLNTLSY